MTEKRFRDCLIEFDDAKYKLKKERDTFESEVKEFMETNGISVKIKFFGTTFGLDIDFTKPNVSRKIPLLVLMDFCKKFGCDFEYTNCNGRRYIFSFDGLTVGY